MIRFLVSTFIALGFLSSLAAAAEPAKPAELLKDAKRILFLGDSITAAGQYIAYFETWLALQNRGTGPAIIDCGLPSETVSGLSENGHAGGKFPRPDLFERLSRVLDATKPDLVVACYGINCGIYEPFDEQRLAKYQAGVRRLKTDVEKRGAKLIFVTPPYYDDLRSPKKFSYNGVLDRYAEWLVGEQKEGLTVIDLHSAMTKEVAARREKEPKFTMQPDGVHPNNQGHWFIARQLIGAFGGKSESWGSFEQMLTAEKAPAGLAPLVQQRMSVLRDAYVSAAGHKRPGVAAGLPIAEAEKKAAELSEKVRALLK